jgi:hypothetical protein
VLLAVDDSGVSELHLIYKGRGKQNEVSKFEGMELPRIPNQILRDITNIAASLIAILLYRKHD